MKELGEYLKKAREARNISLRDIQEITKIRQTYLEAMERGDFSGLPGEVYCKGFLSSYAGAVGLDPQDVIQRYHALKAGPEVPTMAASPANAPVNPTMKPTEPDIPKKRKSGRGVGITVVSLGILLGLVAVVLILAPEMPWNRTPAKTAVTTKAKVKRHLKKPAVKPAQTAKPVTGTEPAATAKPDQSPLPSETAEPAATETITKRIFPAPITIYASFTEPVWVRISKDGELLEDGKTYLPSDAQQLWTAQQEMNITIGNAAGIKLQLNGKDQGVLGGHNQVLKLKITPDGNVAKGSANL